MTTSRSPRSVVTAQASRIAKVLKAAERGEQVDPKVTNKLEAARKDKTDVKFAIFMDDKLLSLQLPWKEVAEASEEALTEYIVKEMLGLRNG